MKSYQLHSAPDRHSLFAELAARVWREDDVLRMWVVTDPRLIPQILRSPKAEIVDLAGIVAAVKAKFGIELPHMEYACRVLPMMVRDDVHASIRKQFAAFLSGCLAELDTQLPGIVRSSLAPLRGKGQVDIIGQVINPLLQRAFSIFLKSEMPAEFLTLHVTEVLSFKATLTHLKSLDTRIGTVLSHLRTTTLDEEEVGWKFTCVAFGLHAVTMMLAESVVMAVRESGEAGRAVDKLPDFPIETGAPVSHRRVKTSFEVDGNKFEPGDFIRLQMQVLGYSRSSEERKYIFGAGAHTCLGKHVSLRIWDAFRREFDAIGLKARIIDYTHSPSHYIIFHESVQIEVL